MKKDDFRQQFQRGNEEGKSELCQTNAIQWILTEVRWRVLEQNCWKNMSQNKINHVH